MRNKNRWIPFVAAAAVVFSPIQVAMAETAEDSGSQVTQDSDRDALGSKSGSSSSTSDDDKSDADKDSSTRETKSGDSKDAKDSKSENKGGETLDKLKKAAESANGLTVALSEGTGDISVSGDDKELYSASVIKLGVAAAAVKDLQGHDSDIQLMITKSDNNATNNLINALGNGNPEAGFAKVNDLTSQVVKDGTYNLANLMGGTEYKSRVTAKGIAQVLQGILASSEGKSDWIPEDGAKKIIDLMKQQTVQTKLGAGMKVGTQLANKTGEHPLAGVTHDAGYMFSGDKTFVVAVTSSFTPGDNAAFEANNSKIAALAKEFSGILEGGKDEKATESTGGGKESGSSSSTSSGSGSSSSGNGSDSGSAGDSGSTSSSGSSGSGSGSGSTGGTKKSKPKKKIIKIEPEAPRGGWIIE